MFYILRSVGMDIAIDMRVAVDEFVAYSITNVGDIESFLLFRHKWVENDVQQNVAQFLFNAGHVVALNGIGEFERLFYRVAAQWVESLLFIPRALGS